MVLGKQKSLNEWGQTQKKKISTKLKSRQTLSKHKGSAQSEKKESETKHNENTGFPFC